MIKCKHVPLQLDINTSFSRAATGIPRYTNDDVVVARRRRVRTDALECALLLEIVLRDGSNHVTVHATVRPVPMPMTANFIVSLSLTNSAQCLFPPLTLKALSFSFPELRYFF